MMVKHKIGYKLLIFILIVAISILHFMPEPSNRSLHQFYRLLYFIPIILSSFKFGFKGGTITALLISVIYSPQKLLSIGFGSEAINELLDILLFFAVGIITGILVEKKNLAIIAIDNQLKKYVILENYTNSIFESIRNGIVSINNDFFITSINSGAKNILGVSSDCIGVNFIEIFSCCEDISQIVADAMRAGKPVENIEKSIIRDNKAINIKIHIYPLSLDNKNKGLVIIIEDITEIKIIMDQMQRNDKLASVGQLATGIAHEIRNPLAIIKMIEQTMKSELKDNEDAIIELNVIDEEVERANKVIKSLMEFGKPSKNEKKNSSLNEIMEDVLIILNKYVSQHKVKVNFYKGETPYGEFDKEQLKQAFVNLIFNAVDAMPQGGEINISTEDLSHNWIKVVFQDTGIGIEENNLSNIFNPFFTTKEEGTGLGLPIVHRIVEDHEGIIKVTSSVGEGTKFEILFPITEKGHIRE
jgi:PAS domain S-box-containing protein